MADNPPALPEPYVFNPNNAPEGYYAVIKDGCGGCAFDHTDCQEVTKKFPCAGRQDLGRPNMIFKPLSSLLDDG